VKRRLLLRRLVSVLVLTILVTGIAWIGLSVGFLVGFQNRATDSLFPAAPYDKRVVVVGLDRQTVDEVFAGTYSGKRGPMAQLVDQLHAAGAKVIVFDVVFQGPSATDPAGDAAFAEAITRAGNVVLAETADPRTSGTGPPKAKAGTASGVYAPFAKGAAGIAHAQVTQDPNDGVVRSLPLVFDINGDFVPALSVAAFMAARGESAPPIVRAGGVQAGSRFIPSDSTTNMIVNWTTKLSDPPEEISARDVINGTMNPARLRNKIVFIGDTRPTVDVRLAPTDKSSRLPGVFIHANATNTMVNAAYLAPLSDASTLGWVALLTALVALAVLMLPFWLSPFVALLVGAGYFAFVLVSFDRGSMHDLVYPLLAIIGSFFAAMGVKYFGETRQRRRVTALFSQYVPEEVAQRLVDEDRAELAAEGQRLDMTVLFCDLRGFTALSEKLPPSIVRTMLDHYYDRVTELVLTMRGTLMKYVGDEVFAVWGAPMPSTDHPELALECAIAIQALTPSLNEELRERGAPEVAFGIGLNTGEAVAAHFGGGRRRQYDVVGDTVNVGARLCSAAGRGDIILSDQVLERVPNPPPVEPVGHVELKGVTRDITLWRVIREVSGNVSATDSVGATADRDGTGILDPEGESEPSRIAWSGLAASVTEAHADGVEAEGQAHGRAATPN